MLKDITIGLSIFRAYSVVHKMDPRLKIVLIIAYIIILFMSTNIPGLLLCGVCAFSLYKVAKVPVKMLVKSIKPLLPLIFFTVVLNLFFITGQGDPLVSFWNLKFTRGRFVLLGYDRPYSIFDFRHISFNLQQALSALQTVWKNF